MDEAAARAAFEAALESYEPAFGRFFLARLFGLEISYGEETCRITMPVHDFMFNPQGTLHGGVTAFLLDVSMGHLLNRSAGPGVTLEMRTQYLRGTTRGPVTAEARFLKRGRSINFLETRLTGPDGAVLAVASSTWQLLPKPTGG